ncbi:MAG: S9 family peptidase [Planctomycetes bacterium]|nr:S9 family peptidase [Planctomycetota bacterium]
MRTNTTHHAFLPLAIASCFATALVLPGQERIEQANWRQAEKFGSQGLRKFVYSTSVTPNWIGKSEKFWYSYRTSAGTRFWLVDAEQQTKVPLFDHAALATALSVATKKAQLGIQLELGGLRLDDKGETLQFTNEGRRFEYTLANGTLVDKGPVPTTPTRPGSNPATGLSDEERQRTERGRERGNQQQEQQEQQEQQQQQQEEQKQEQQTGQQGQRREGAADATPASSRRERPDVRVLSPDGRAFVVARDHEIWFGEGVEEPLPPEAPVQAPTAPAATSATIGEAGKTDAEKANAVVAQTGDRANGATTTTTVAAVATKEGTATKDPAAPADPSRPSAPALPKKTRIRFDEATAVKLSKDSIEGYSFASGGTPGRGDNQRTEQRTDQRTDTKETPAPGPVRARPNATWSKDSQAFFATRRDTRGVQQPPLVDSLAEPRPTLQTYSYSMPGDAVVSQSELWWCLRNQKELRQVERKWIQESYQNVHFFADGHELRFVRRDRLQQNAEFCALELETGKVRVLLSESVTDATLALQSHRYLEKKKQFVWWSERSAWGHFYLHDATTGASVNAITSGTFRASRLIEVDEESSVLWFRGNGREAGENIYHEHLYRVNLDGTDLVCLDPGDATHNSTLSPSRRHVVDTFSRVDLEPRSVLRSGRDGRTLLELEKTDLSKLTEMGWKMPERFTVKAADGITDLYGNLWKPFDFDANRRYPLIVNVYPGPQQEGVTHTFSATASTQQLAQLGFIVIQVGHRGGTPARDKAYGAFGFGNLRDYGLEDKKTAIEQLADRHAFLDITRVGIYGHSGGGFMTAAAMMKPPYNRFFKVGVASAGNHDNNIYNASWSERWHGLSETEKAKDTAKTAATQAGKDAAAGTATTQDGKADKAGTATTQDGKTDKAGTVTTQDGKTDKKGTVTTQDGKADKAGTATTQDGKADKAGTATTQDGKTDKAGTATTGAVTTGTVATGETKQGELQQQQGQRRGSRDGQGDTEKTAAAAAAAKSPFEIKVPTNAELAPNLEGKLLLVHGEIDNNVHPANTMRLVDALIKANKRFDMLIIPGARHSFGAAQDYFRQRMFEYFAEHLLGDREAGSDITRKDVK